MERKIDVFSINKMVDDLMKSGRPWGAIGAEIVEISGVPRYLRMPMDQALRRLSIQASGVNTRKSGADADQSITALEVALAAESVGVVASWKDSDQLSDRRLFDMVVTWNDGSARTATITLDPHSSHVTVVGIMAHSDNEVTTIIKSTAAGVTATIAQNATRTGSSLSAYNIIERDIQSIE